MKPLYAIGSVSSLSGHAIAYRWRSLPRVRRHRASKPPMSLDYNCNIGSINRIDRMGVDEGVVNLTGILYYSIHNGIYLYMT